MLALRRAAGGIGSLLRELCLASSSSAAGSEAVRHSSSSSSLSEPSTSQAPAYLSPIHVHDRSPPYVPWTPTMELVKRRKLAPRMRYLRSVLEEQRLQEALQTRQFPPFRASDILEVRVMVPENNRQEYVYRGVCVERKNRGIRSSFKIFNVFPDAGGVMQHFPLFMPDLLEVRIVGRIKDFGEKSNIRRQVLELADSSAGAKKFRFQDEVKPLALEAAATGGSKAAIAPAAAAGGKAAAPAAKPAAKKK